MLSFDIIILGVPAVGNLLRIFKQEHPILSVIHLVISYEKNPSLSPKVQDHSTGALATCCPSDVLTNLEGQLAACFVFRNQ